MAYATVQDMIDLYGENEYLIAFDRDGDGVADVDDSGDPIASLALENASEEIDGYLARYSLPFATVPKVLPRLNIDIAYYRGSVGAAMTEEKRKRYEDAVKFLSAIAKGDIQLFGGDATATQGGTGATFSAGTRRFTRDNMRGV